MIWQKKAARCFVSNNQTGKLRKAGGTPKALTVWDSSISSFEHNLMYANIDVPITAVGAGFIPARQVKMGGDKPLSLLVHIVTTAGTQLEI